jgi:imidazolonepropionase-like amidohydrolase
MALLGSDFLLLAVLAASGAPNASPGPSFSSASLSPSAPLCSSSAAGETAVRDAGLQIQAREVWTAAGERIPNGVVVIADGKVLAVGDERALDASRPLVRHDGVLTAGLIACRTWSGAGAGLQDDTRSVLPHARAADAIDLDSRDFERLLAAGITSVGIAPGPESLVGGLACVVKTTARMLEDEAALALSLSSSALGRSTSRGGFLFGSAEDEESGGAPEAPGASQQQGGPETSARTTRGTREPTSFPGALALLTELLARGSRSPRENDPFARVKAGELPVTIEAWERHEVLRAARFAAEHRLVGAIRGAPLAGDPDVIAALKASGLGVIVGPYTSGQTRRSLESVRHLAEAGVPVAFALDAPARPAEELRLSAVRALAAGASQDAVWKALTEDAARLAGVGGRVGQLAKGQEADLVLWSGNPLDLSSRVVAVYVDGVRAWPASTER